MEDVTDKQNTEQKFSRFINTLRDKDILSVFTKVAKSPGSPNTTDCLSFKDANVSTTNEKCNQQNVDNVEKAAKKHSCTHEIKLYKQRFLMLFVFAICTMMNGFTAFQYTVVADIVSCYYDVSLSDVNWTCDVHMVVFLLLAFPVMYFMDKKGIKITLVIAAILNFAGSFVQCFTFVPDRFLVVMTCQTLYAIGQVFVLSLPPFIAAVWFGAGVVGLACAMGVFGNQLGVALGFCVPPTTISNNCTDQTAISYDLSRIAYPMVTINTIILCVVIFVFQEKPKSFPSIAQATKATCKTNYVKSLTKFFIDTPFVLLLLGYGLITGTYFSISTLMNEMVLTHFPGEEVIAGTMGALLVFSGMFGSVTIGALLDRTHKYKEISVFVFFVSFVIMFAYTFLIQLEKFWIQFVMFTFLGFIMTGYLPAGFDFGAEITYPEPEAMSASLLNASTQIFSIILTNIASPLLEFHGDISSNLFFCACLLTGTIIMACIKYKLKRSDAETEASDKTSQSIEDSVS